MKREKLLRLRLRADSYELEAINLRTQRDEAVAAAEKRANEAIVKAAREAESVRAGSTETRQKIARLETELARAVEALEFLDPRAPIEGLETATSATVTMVSAPSPGWRDIVTRTDLWYAERGRLIKNEIKAAGLKRPEPGVPGFVTNDDGQSVSFFSAAAGSGGNVRRLPLWPGEQ